MRSGVSNILNDLKSISNSADSIICNSNDENEQVHCWFNKIKDLAHAIVNGTNSNTGEGESSTSRSSSFKIDLDFPNLVTLIKGKQSKAHRVSNLLAEVKKDHVRRSNRQSRKSKKSLRKIVLEKKSGNRWEISNPEINLEDNGKKSDKNNTSVTEIEDLPINEIKDKLLESHVKLSFEANKSLKKKYLPELSFSLNAKQDEGDTCCTPTRNNTHQYLNADSLSPMTRSKIKILDATQIVKGKKNPILVPQCNPSLDLHSPLQLENHVGKKSLITTITTKAPSSDTLNNETITIESDEEFKTPMRQTKRKSSFQDSQNNAKKTKKAHPRMNVKESSRTKKLKREDSLVENQKSKRMKVTKDATNPVIPAKTSNSFVQRNTSINEKKILRELQKKEEIVSQNTRRIKSQRKMKIEENKKVREMKMEKALQQRLMLEKEKEERLRTRTHSTQGNTQQKETHSRKKVPKKELQQEIKNNCADKTEDTTSINKESLTINKTLKSNEAVSPSRDMQKHNKPDFSKTVSNEDITLKDKHLILSETKIYDNNTKNATTSSIQTPVRHVRSKAINTTQNVAPVLPVKTPIKHDKLISKETTLKNNAENSKVVPVQNNEVFVKPTLNATFVSSPKDKNMKSPAIKKVGFKENLAKTPASNSSKKPTSYPMTPLESSFVSYDVSEIKDDDEEDEEETNTKKPIPSWALGVSLRNTLLNQHYNPIDTEELFGNYFEIPDLGKVMGTRKKHYYKRTSSAIWTKSPNRSILADV